MSRFITELAFVDAPVAGFYDLTAALIYSSDIAKAVIIAPRGTRTNFVTGRKLLIVRRIVQDKMNRAAVIHDELYGSGMLPRKLSDDVFYEAMRVDGVAWWRAMAAYSAVRLMGAQFYKGSLPVSA